jgi:hypothetical protein
VTTQLPTITLKPNEKEWIAASRYRRESRTKLQSSRSRMRRPACGASGASASSTAASGTTTIVERYGARNPVHLETAGMSATAMPRASTDEPPYIPCSVGEPPCARM